jgi:hypothetical protein
VQDGIETDAVFYGFPSVLAEAIEKITLVVLVESIYNFIGKTHKAIDAINGIVHFSIEAINAQ